MWSVVKGVGGGGAMWYVVRMVSNLWSVVRVVSTMWYVVCRAVGRLLKRGVALNVNF